MSEIQRYRFSRCKLHFDPHICMCGQRADANGEFIHHADHLSALAAKDAEIRVLREALERILSISRITFSRAAAKGNVLAGNLAKDIAEKADSALATAPEGEKHVPSV